MSTGATDVETTFAALLQARSQPSAGHGASLMNSSRGRDACVIEDTTCVLDHCITTSVAQMQAFMKGAVQLNTCLSGEAESVASQNCMPC